MKIKIQNVVVSTHIDAVFPLTKIAEAYEDAEYEPEAFPGLVVRLKDPNITALVFRSGTVVCVGGGVGTAVIYPIVKGMKETGLNILVNRGADILGYNYEKIKSALHSLKDDEIFIKPLIPLVSEIEDKVDVFARNDIANGFRAVDWCVSHGLVQQAITMLFENLITHILNLF